MTRIESYWVSTHTLTPHTPSHHTYPVRDVIPTLMESREIQIERPISRSDGQTVILKTSHLCQWLESVAAYFTTVTAQTHTDSKGTFTKCLPTIKMHGSVITICIIVQSTLVLDRLVGRDYTTFS